MTPGWAWRPGGRRVRDPGLHAGAATGEPVTGLGAAREVAFLSLSVYCGEGGGSFLWGLL